jgi:uncharacterized repeat protein (TIGR03803 family)
MFCALLVVLAVDLEAATYKTLYSFTGFSDAGTPFAGVIFDRYGNLYGVAAWGQTNEGNVYRLSPYQGEWKFTSLHRFALNDTEASEPIGGLALDEFGNLYGTGSYVHGPSDACSSVFKLSSEGFTIIHYFYGEDGCDAESDLSYFDGRLWGTTRSGGSKGQGTVFSMDTQGDSFRADSFWGMRGSEPLGGINSWGYGTTFSGGGSSVGNIYKLDSALGFINKFSFSSIRKAGYAPRGNLLTAEIGGVRTMFGTNSAGGALGGGSVYRLTEVEPQSDRWRVTALYSFAEGSSDGYAPMAGLTADAAGNLYGTTFMGGNSDWNCGTVFKLSPQKNGKWIYTVLYQFNGYESDGCNPTSGVVLDGAGNLYGTTTAGGDYSAGTIYEITP